MAEPLTPTQRRALLVHARACLQAAARGDKAPVPPPLSVAHGGVFVTLKSGGALRGCIGRFDGAVSLAALTGEMTRAAALEDPRFRAVDAREAAGLTISLSRLTPLVACPQPDTIEVGRHGVQISLRGRRAVFLPQVAPEQGWDRAALLAALCEKAGLPLDAWRDPAARLQVFEAEVFGEDSMEMTR